MMTLNLNARGRRNVLTLAEQARGGNVDAMLFLADLADSIHVREEGVAAIDSGNWWAVDAAVNYALEAIGV